MTKHKKDTTPGTGIRWGCTRARVLLRVEKLRTVPYTEASGASL